MIIYGIDKIANIHTTVLMHINTVSAAIGITTGIFAMFYLGSKIWSNYAKNEPLDLWVLLKPFVIGLICLNFSLITNFVEVLYSPFETFTLGFYQTGKNKSKQVSAEKAQQISQAKAKEYAKQQEWIDAQKQFSGSSKNAFYVANVDNSSNIQDRIMDGLLNIVAMVAKLIGYIAALTLLVSRCISLVLLYILGPLAFALALIPGWHTNILMWFSKYASILMWLPMYYLIGGAGLYIDATLTSMINVDALFDKEGFLLGGDMAVTSLSLIINIAMALTVMSIPTMIHWIIPHAANESPGTAGLAATGGFLGAMGGKIIFTGAGNLFSMSKKKENIYPYSPKSWGVDRTEKKKEKKKRDYKPKN